MSVKLPCDFRRGPAARPGSAEAAAASNKAASGLTAPARDGAVGPGASAARRPAVRVGAAVALALALAVGPLRGAPAEEGAAERAMADWLELRTGYDTEVDASADAGAGATARGQSFGSVSDRGFELDASRTTLLAPGWAVSAGVRVAETRLSVPAAAPLPTSLGSIGLPLDLHWRASDTWGWVAEIIPGLNSQGFRSEGADFDVSGSVVGLWRVAPRCLLAGGVEFDAFGSYPLLPAGGVVYAFSPEWTARILFPDPRIAYRCAPGLELFVGAHFMYGSYRMGAGFGRRFGLPKLDHALLSVEQNLYGPGLSWQVNRGVLLDVTGGAETDRHLDYFRAGYAVDLRPAAALRLSLQASF
jgi:hypothetical protein